MVDHRRRVFLGKGASAVLAVAIATKLFPTKVALANGELALCDQAASEFAYVYRSWASSESESPIGYIARCGLTVHSTEEQIQKCSAAQFRSAETMQIDGLVLSKIEAALMAEVGRLYC